MVLREVVKLDLTKDQPEWVVEKVEQLQRIHDAMVAENYTAIVVTMRGNVRHVPHPDAPGQMTVEIDGGQELWRGQVDDLPDVEPIGMLADEDVNQFVQAQLEHVVKKLKQGERIMVNRLISNWAISVMTEDNPQLYVCDVAYIPIWGAKVTEFYAPGGERFLSTKWVTEETL